MKNSSFRFFLFLIFFCPAVVYSQNFSAGISSGINFSDIHGQDPGGKWKSKPGPVQALNLGYSFNRSLGIQTGINFSTIYYQHKDPDYSGPVYPYEYISVIDPGFYINRDEKMDFSFLRIPILFTVSIPSAVQFNMRAGIYFGFLQDYNLGTYNYYSSMAPDKPKKNDFGYMFSSGIAYPVNANFKATFNAGYLTGRKEFLENSNYRHGASEFTFGLEYTGFIKDKYANIIPRNESDSTSKKVTVTIIGGLNYSWNRSSADYGNYLGNPGPVLGFSLNLPLGKGICFQTGFSFERKGYSIRDSSTSFYRLTQEGNQMYYADTKVQIDYAIIPAVLSFPIGKTPRFIFSTGPWFGLRLNARNVGVAYNETRSGNSYELRKTIVYDDIEKSIKNYDAGWIFNLGMSVPVNKNNKVEIALRYSSSFINVFDNSGSGDQQNPGDAGFTIRNRTLSMIFGFTIPPFGH